MSEEKKIYWTIIKSIQNLNRELYTLQEIIEDLDEEKDKDLLALLRSACQELEATINGSMEAAHAEASRVEASRA